jgi:4-alpha-glucanotransferase
MAEAINRLARAAGLSPRWIDATGRGQTVKPESLRAVLTALGLPADNDRLAKESLAALRQRKHSPSPLQVARAGGAIGAPQKGRVIRLWDEKGAFHDCRVEQGMLRLPAAPGYYRLDGEERRIAAAPARAFLPAKRFWGIGVQTYALRGGTSAGFGDFAALAGFCHAAAGLGADAVAISPVHALFAANPGHFSPYAPSTRLWLNPLYATLPRKAPDRNGHLIDWPAAAKRKWRALRDLFERQSDDAAFRAFVRQGGARLLAHARFEVLDARFRRLGLADWRQWPEDYRRPGGPAVRRLTEKDRDIAFQLFAQWQADRSLAAAQATARDGGMTVGLIADLAVGMDPAGSHAWSAQDEVLQGLTVGAPADDFNGQGQNWGLTGFAPQALAESGYAGFTATLQAAMRHAGGIRIDHAMGLQRLWVIPQGGGAADGVYLQYPLKDLLGLVALESQRHRALVLAEDLGTVPQGFRAQLARRHMLGMRVLWFERDGDRFLPPSRWDTMAAGLSTTHDLPTLAGWWKGCDLAWNRKLGRDPKPAASRQRRQRDKLKMWQMLKQAGDAKGAMPQSAAPFADAVFAALGRAPCAFVLAPVEDFIGLTEQPNIPGTIDEHPNWRRRLSTATPLGGPAAHRRAKRLGRSS